MAGVTKWGMYCVLVNALVGAGILTLPKAFQTGGLLVSFVCLFIIALINWLIHRELLEMIEELSLARSEYSVLLEEDRLLKSPHQWDLPEIVRQILGPVAEAVYFCFFGVYAIAGIATYIRLFEQATRALVFEAASEYRWVDYRVTILFVLVVGTLATLDYAQQIWVHRVMAVAQFIVAVLIVKLSITHSLNREHSGIPSVPPNFASFLSTTKVLIFACIYQVIIPSILAASAKHSKSQSQVALWMFLSTIAMYGAVGCVAGMVLHDPPPNISSLFFKQFSFDFTSILAVAIIAIPALDMISNSLLFCHALSGSVFTALYGTDHQAGRRNHPQVHLALRAGCVLPSFVVASLFQLVSVR